MAGSIPALGAWAVVGSYRVMRTFIYKIRNYMETFFKSSGLLEEKECESLDALESYLTEGLNKLGFSRILMSNYTLKAIGNSDWFKNKFGNKEFFDSDTDAVRVSASILCPTHIRQVLANYFNIEVSTIVPVPETLKYAPYLLSSIPNGSVVLDFGERSDKFSVVSISTEY